MITIIKENVRRDKKEKSYYKSYCSTCDISFLCENEDIRTYADKLGFNAIIVKVFCECPRCKKNVQAYKIAEEYYNKLKNENNNTKPSL